MWCCHYQNDYCGEKKLAAGGGTHTAHKKNERAKSKNKRGRARRKQASTSRGNEMVSHLSWWCCGKMMQTLFFLQTLNFFCRPRQYEMASETARRCTKNTEKKVSERKRCLASQVVHRERTLFSPHAACWQPSQ